MSALTLGTSSIRELDGLYSLNDLHRASGEAERHMPFRFMRLESTRALVVELNQSPETVNGETPEMVSGVFQIVKGSVNPGTWVCRELVIAYAAWISAAFHLRVLRVFLSTQVPTQAPSDSGSESVSEFMRKMRTGEHPESVCHPRGGQLTKAEGSIIRRLMNRKANELPNERRMELFSACQHALRERFAVDSVFAIPSCCFIEAIGTLANIFDLYSLAARPARPAQTIAAAWLGEGGASFTAEGLSRIIHLAANFHDPGEGHPG